MTTQNDHATLKTQELQAIDAHFKAQEVRMRTPKRKRNAFKAAAHEELQAWRRMCDVKREIAILINPCYKTRKPSITFTEVASWTI